MEGWMEGWMDGWIDVDTRKSFFHIFANTPEFRTVFWILSEETENISLALLFLCRI
jgi:hypothetical protein